jgi:hypothetical protein
MDGGKNSRINRIPARSLRLTQSAPPPPPAPPSAEEALCLRRERNRASRALCSHQIDHKHAAASAGSMRFRQKSRGRGCCSPPVACSPPLSSRALHSPPPPLDGLQAQGPNGPLERAPPSLDAGRARGAFASASETPPLAPCCDNYNTPAALVRAGTAPRFQRAVHYCESHACPKPWPGPPATQAQRHQRSSKAHSQLCGHVCMPIPDCVAGLLAPLVRATQGMQQRPCRRSRHAARRQPATRCGRRELVPIRRCSPGWRPLLGGAQHNNLCVRALAAAGGGVLTRQPHAHTRPPARLPNSYTPPALHATCRVLTLAPKQQRAVLLQDGAGRRPLRPARALSGLAGRASGGMCRDGCCTINTCVAVCVASTRSM